VTTATGPSHPRPSTTPGRGLRQALPPAGWLAGWFVLLLVVFIGLGWLLAKVATGNDLGRLDAGLTRELATDRTATLNRVTGWCSLLAETLTVVVVGVGAAAIARTAFRRWREPMLLAAAVIGEVLLFLLLTALVDRPRPTIAQLDEAPPTSSFPSGHTAAAVALYGALAVIVRQRLRSPALGRVVVALAVLIPVLVGLSRVYRGMHYVSDVLGGAMLGAAWLAVAVAGQRRRRAGAVGR